MYLTKLRSSPTFGTEMCIDKRCQNVGGMFHIGTCHLQKPALNDDCPFSDDFWYTDFFILLADRYSSRSECGNAL